MFIQHSIFRKVQIQCPYKSSMSDLDGLSISLTWLSMCVCTLFLIVIYQLCWNWVLETNCLTFLRWFAFIATTSFYHYRNCVNFMWRSIWKAFNLMWSFLLNGPICETRMLILKFFLSKCNILCFCFEKDINQLVGSSNLIRNWEKWHCRLFQLKVHERYGRKMED